MQQESNNSELSQYFGENKPLELLDVEIRKNRARIPNKRPPSIDFLKRSKNIAEDTELEDSTITPSSFTMDEDVEFRPAAASRRLSFATEDTPITRTPSIRRVESFAPPREANTAPQWLLELKRKKKRDGDGTETTKTNTPVTSDPPIDKNEEKHNQTKSSPTEEKPSSCVSEAKSDYSAKSRWISKSRSNKPLEAKPTLTELQKGAEKINNSIAELQKDMQILLEQIKQAQITEQ